MAFTISRRALLTTAAIAAPLAGVAGIAAIVSGEDDMVRTILRRHIGAFEIDDNEFNTFLTDFRLRYVTPTGMQADAMRLGAAAGLLETAIRAAPSGLGSRMEAFERQVVTAFVLSTDYYELDDPAKDRLSYVGLFEGRPCANPFARFT